MGLILTAQDKIVDDFIKRSKKQIDKLRQQDSDEIDICMDIRRVNKSANLCMTELLFVKEVIKRFNYHDLYYVVMNFERIINSVHKQRNFMYALFCAISRTKPSEEEKNAIKSTISKFYKRIAFIHEVPIQENIKLTPIQEYLDIIGETNFMEEIREIMPTGKEIFESMTNGSMDRLISSMLTTLKNEGKDELYKGRLSEYTKMIRERCEKEKEEREKERTANAKSEAENGIGLFIELFCRGIRNLKTETSIHLTERSIREHLNAGHRGKFCILCCGYRNGKIMYRYVANGQNIVPRFGNVSLYESIDDANREIASLINAYPDRAFAPIAI